MKQLSVLSVVARGNVEECRQAMDLMRKFEVVQAGSDVESDERYWGHRLSGSSRCTFLLRDEDGQSLAYLLMSAGPSPAKNMDQIYGDAYESEEKKAVSFYSVTSTSNAKGAGREIIQQAAKLLQAEGICASTGLPASVAAAAAGGEEESPYCNIPLMYTMSPIPSLRKTLEAEGKQQMIAALDAQDEAVREDALAWTRDYIENGGDPVGRFHMSNGATLLRVNWAADSDMRRLKQSFGMMCNYDYNKKD